jgi:hypothetical protein
MFIERREQGRPGEFAELSNEELDGRLIASLTARGMTVEQATEFINRVPRQVQIEHQPADPGEGSGPAEKRRPGDGDGKPRSGAGSGRGMTEPQAREFINRVPVPGVANGSGYRRT